MLFGDVLHCYFSVLMLTYSCNINSFLLPLLKFVNEKLKKWNWEVFGDNRIKKKDILKELEVLDKSECKGRLEEDQNVCRVAL